MLATQLAEQRELLAKTQKEAEEAETALLAEFASERSSWSDREAMWPPASMRLKTSLMVSFFTFFL